MTLSEWKNDFKRFVKSLSILRDDYKEIIEYIDDIPELHWIPVTEKPPEVSGCYLVSVKNDHERRYSKTAWFGKGVWFARQDVLAWMPLPEPFKGVTE